MSPVSKILADLQASMARYRNIKPGEDFEGYKERECRSGRSALGHLQTFPALPKMSESG
jgi:hypothetical protein